MHRHAERLAAYKKGFRFLLVPTWILPPYQRGYGLLDWRSGLGFSQLLARLNLRLAEALEEMGTPDAAAALDARATTMEASARTLQLLNAYDEKVKAKRGKHPVIESEEEDVDDEDEGEDAQQLVSQFIDDEAEEVNQPEFTYTLSNLSEDD